MLIQNPHSVVSHEAPESHAVKCVLENLDANGLGRVLLKGVVGSAAQTLVDPVWVGWDNDREEFGVYASVKWCG